MIKYLYPIIIFFMIFIIFYLINNLLKRDIQENYQGIISDSFFEELKKKKYDVNQENKIITYNGNSISYSKHFNSDEAVKNAKNKIITSQILSKNNIPIPKFIKIDIPTSVNNVQNLIHNNGIEYPVVIKPVNGTFGYDVMTDLETTEELNDTLKYFEENGYSEVTLEEQIDGDCYRIFVFNGNVLDVIKREKPYIIGNGKDTVAKLIEKRNEEQLKMDLMEIKNISEIVIEKQGYTLDSVLDNGKKIYISNVINMHNGARISRIPLENIPDKNIKLFIAVNKAMDIKCSGIDFLSNDICIPYDENNGRVLEVNGTPDTEIHQKIKDYNFFERLVNSIF